MTANLCARLREDASAHESGGGVYAAAIEREAAARIEAQEIANKIARNGYQREQDQRIASEARCAELYEALSGMVGLCALLLCNDLPPNVREGLTSNHRVIEAKRVLAAIDAAIASAEKGKP